MPLSMPLDMSLNMPLSMPLNMPLKALGLRRHLMSVANLVTATQITERERAFSGI